MTPADNAPTEGSRAAEARSASAVSTGRRKIPLIVWLATAFVGVIVGIAVLLQTFVARRLPDLTPESLEAAEARWDERGPANYNMDFEISGAQPGVVHVEVRNGEVVAMSRDGITPRQPRTWVYWSVPGRFDEIARELELAEDPEHEMNAATGTRVLLRCDFDPEFGYPRAFHRMIFGGGPEVYWRVTSFTPY